jgi:hypothetical protein
VLLSNSRSTDFTITKRRFGVILTQANDKTTASAKIKAGSRVIEIIPSTYQLSLTKHLFQVF